MKKTIIAVIICVALAALIIWMGNTMFDYMNAMTNSLEWIKESNIGMYESLINIDFKTAFTGYLVSITQFDIEF